VLEGSRLGGTVLSRRIGPGLPRAFLLSAHPPGGWRAVMAAIDALPAGWRDGALAGASAAFALFLAACAREQAAQTVAAVGTV
jgi:heme oxygenase